MACDRFKDRSRAPRSPTRADAEVKGATTLDEKPRRNSGERSLSQGRMEREEERRDDGERGEEREREKGAKGTLGQPEGRAASEVYFISFAAKSAEDR